MATGTLLSTSMVATAAPAGADVQEDAEQGDSNGEAEDQDQQGDQGATEMPSTMLILDASGSMAADDGDASGMTRMEAAQQAVGEVAGGVPDNAPLGLVVYGANVSSAPEDQEEGCQDIEVLASPEVGQSDEITGAVADIEASGYTPIGESLRVADSELPDNGERSIILVSDGIDTCAPPPPCEVAAELDDAGVDLRLHAIGFKVDDEARADLECIAEEGGGTYADAEDAEELAEEMARAAMRGMRGYEVAGEPIEGGTSPMQAPEIGPGDYVDVLEEGASGSGPSDGTQKYYRIPLEQGERLHVTATMIGPEGNRSIWSGSIMDNAQLSMRMSTDEEDECEAIGERNSGSLNFNEGLVAWGVSEPLGSEECQGTEILIELQRGGSMLEDEPFDVELLVRTEPADMDTSQMPAPATEPQGEELISSIEADEGDSELFGTSFADATPIEPGTYTARAVIGERNFVRVPVAYGQTMRFAVEVEDGPDVPANSTRFTAAMANPLRQPVPLWDGDDVTGDQSNFATAGNSVAANMVTEVNFANRDNEEADPEELRHTYLGGEHYLMIGINQVQEDLDADAEQLEWTYNLVVEVDGEPIDGPQMSLGSATDDDGDVTREDGDDRSAAGGDEDADEDHTRDGSEGAAPTGGSADEGGLSAALPFVIGGGVLLALAGGGAWLAVRQLRS